MASCRSEKSRLAGVSSTEITIPSKGPARRMGINPWDCKPWWARRRSLRGGKLACGQVDTGRSRRRSEHGVRPLPKFPDTKTALNLRI